MTDPITAIDPGSGRRERPRAHLASDAAALDLTGTWRFHLSPTAAQAPAEAGEPGFDDSGWDDIAVPSHWVLQRTGEWGSPIYTNVVFPFPVEPPFVPDANPTGDHRRRFDVADGFVPDGGRAVLRFAGVDSIAIVHLNGVEVGIVRGSRLPQELDVTSELRVGENLLHVRVHQWSAMSYIEDQDQWWLPGIFREVTLLARPASGLDDVWLRADYDPSTGSGALLPEIRGGYPVRVTCADLGLDATLDGPTDRIDVGPVEPWSADVPRCYDIEVFNAAETVTVRVGFRRVGIDGDAWLVNGRRLRLRGVNRHEFHRTGGRVFDAEQARSDLMLMKRGNLNAIRTSHYPPHPTLLDLADELGFWVIDECDIETHGFGMLDWVGNPSDDPAWRDCYLDRVERMVERDKNHPCIVAWSLGNEAGTGVNLAAMSEWIHRRDPGRPVHYEGDHAGAYTDLNSRMYPPVEELEDLAAGIGDNGSGIDGTAAKLLDRPMIMCEYVHAMGNGAGGIDGYEAVIDAHPIIHGGFVWEWRDHGLLTHTADGTPYFAYGGDFGEELHDGSFVCDGMTLADGTPTPMLAEYAAVVSPIKLVLAVNTLTVTNLRHAGDTSDLDFVWTHERDGHPLASGSLTAVVQPGESMTVDLPDLDISARGEHFLGIAARLAAATPWAAAGHTVARTQLELTTPDRSLRSLAGGANEVSRRRRPERGEGAGAPIQLGEATFDATTGALLRIGNLAIGTPEVTLWRAPTANDSLSPASAERWRAIGLDRLHVRVTGVEMDETGLTVTQRIAPAGHSRALLATLRWTWGDGLRLDLTAEPVGDWPSTWPRAGVHFALPKGYERAAWFGTGPAENYADSRTAARVGRFDAPIDELGVAYAVPQETGHRADLRELTITGSYLPTLTIGTNEAGGRRPGFTLSRYSAEELAAACHPHELPVPGATHLYLDAFQHGLGSSSCGPDVTAEHQLWPRDFTVSVQLHVAG